MELTVLPVLKKNSATIRNSTNEINGPSEIVATAKISNGVSSKGLTQNKTDHKESKSTAKLNNRNHETNNFITNDDLIPNSNIENKNRSDHGWTLVNNRRGNSKIEASGNSSKSGNNLKDGKQRM
ncbi:hypothetical protein HHI36_005264, partial [Cryptolaemus montrouzieri]